MPKVIFNWQAFRTLESGVWPCGEIAVLVPSSRLEMGGGSEEAGGKFDRYFCVILGLDKGTLGFAAAWKEL